jgi:predicted RNA-binding protein (TIGR00451 family)
MRRTLSRKERSEFLQKNRHIANDEKKPLQIDEKEGLCYLGNEIAAIIKGHDIIPYLKNKANKIDDMPSVIIDMPAVPHIANGADLLRPGIVANDGFEEGELIIIRDEKNKVGIAIMRAIVGSGSLHDMEKGKVAKNLHYVNDKHWKMS